MTHGPEIDLTPLIAALAGLFEPVKPPPCRNCGRDQHQAKGLCGRCYWRWWRAGRPAEVPAPFRCNRRTEKPEFEDYCWLRETGSSMEDAARRAGITMRAAVHYEADLRKGAA